MRAVLARALAVHLLVGLIDQLDQRIVGGSRQPPDLLQLPLEQAMHHAPRSASSAVRGSSAKVVIVIVWLWRSATPDT
jgi:hypothetical protein